MDVTAVMDNQTQGKGLLDDFCVESRNDLLIVSAIHVVSFAHQPVGQITKSTNVVFSILMEIREVFYCFTGLSNGLVNEVPAFLPAVTLSLDFVGKRGTLDERMVSFAGRDFRLNPF